MVADGQRSVIARFSHRQTALGERRFHGRSVYLRPNSIRIDNHHLMANAWPSVCPDRLRAGSSKRPQGQEILLIRRTTAGRSPFHPTATRIFGRSTTMEVAESGRPPPGEEAENSGLKARFEFTTSTLSPDGKQLVSAGSAVLQFWNTATGAGEFEAAASLGSVNQIWMCADRPL